MELCLAEEEKLARFILLVDVGSHLILQVYMGPNGEEKLHHISMTPDNGPHAGSHPILRNKMKNKMSYHSDKLEIDICKNRIFHQFSVKIFSLESFPLYGTLTLKLTSCKVHWCKVIVLSINNTNYRKY